MKSYGLRKRCVYFGWFKNPPMHVATTSFANDVHCFREKLWSDACHFVAMVWMHDEVECPRIVATRYLAIGNEVVMVGLTTKQSYISGPTSLAKINPQMIRKWTLTIGALDCEQ
jgi:hypothetical protein